MSRRTGLAAALLIVAAAFVPSERVAAQGGTTPVPDRARLDQGKAVYDQWCAACHDPGPRHPGTQALDALYQGKKPGALVERKDLLPKLTETFVRRGVSVMPPFRKTEISDADLAALAAFLAPRP